MVGPPLVSVFDAPQHGARTRFYTKSVGTAKGKRQTVHMKTCGENYSEKKNDFWPCHDL